MLIVGPLLAALVVASAVAASQPPAPSRSISSAKEQKQSSVRKDDSSSAIDRTPQSPSVVVNIAPTQTVTAQPNTKAEKEEHSSTAEGWTAGATVALACITLGLAIFTFLLWRSTKDLVEDSGETARTGLRAYVKVSPAPPGLIVGHRIGEPELRGFACKVEIKNCGQTPATITDVRLKFVALPKTEELPETPDYITAKTSTFPGHFLAKDESFYKGNEEFGSIGANTPAVKTGDVLVYLLGYVDYIDAFRGRHRAGFLRVFHPELEDRSRYDSDEDFVKRSNFIFGSRRGYNYDRLRKPREGNDWDEEPPA